MRRIIGALIIGIAKKAVSGVFSVLSSLFGLIPGWGQAASFICKLIPAILTFVTT